jgi:hypothetical protein
MDRITEDNARGVRPLAAEVRGTSQPGAHFSPPARFIDV